MTPGTIRYLKHPEFYEAADFPAWLDFYAHVAAWMPIFNGEPLERYRYCRSELKHTPEGYIWEHYDTPEEDVAYSALERHPDGMYVLMPYATGSDYSGSTVERANYLQLIDEHPDVCIPVHGGYGTYVVLVALDEWTPELDDVLRDLEQYPVLSDDQLSHLETELEDEAWEGWIDYEFRSALIDADYPDADVLSDDKLYDLFCEGMEASNAEYIHEQGCSVYVDVERIVSHLVEGN